MIVFVFLALGYTTVIVLGLLWFYDTFWGGEDFATSEHAIQKISEIVSAKKSDGLLYDLGSSRGHVVFSLLKRVPNLQTVGIDNSYLRVWSARLLSFFYDGNPIFKKGDFFNTDISRADFVYLYVPRELLPTLALKLKKELKPGAQIITYRITFSDWKPEQVFLVDSKDPEKENVYVYSSGR
ncbi:hypothetical protein A3D09_04240 [Candidatus Collierbacteria bacterium RIFCSPHIGHO2_02_FULL_49_10]|uniref:DOT1 domain-containing protein n=2 Tax=Patescibacteria group TaxID=1783273 RepID=A0A1F4XSM8_9BACT|nr:MAG: hypothetical protein A3F55_02435 [Candidatus Adlerbacteria bacterium RIFCSPHIGHO2_12_FULL_53_18]OGD70222.1 MAG: hypothetical protein A3D09_04240 [Candidatus Collierbacteria bacterium RIFCSPHIGHO2_02_FULL_49_10]